ncbi:hypothetical protein BDW22DRAFT_396441 [Trametopsis cervina]|nr:hypothetical protein BDW22DRAFT_396441 [Trametopsis cervina]
MNPSYPYYYTANPAVAPTPQLQLIAIRQTPYDAQSSRRNISEPVEFKSAQTREQGILLSNAMHANIEGLLMDAEGVVLNDNVGSKLSLRLQFVGYEPYTKQKYAKTTGREIPVSRAKLARQVAEVVHAFYQEKIQPASDGVRYLSVNDGLAHIQFTDLYLVRVDHVTTGSIQPALAYYGYPNGMTTASPPVVHLQPQPQPPQTQYTYQPMPGSSSSY